MLLGIVERLALLGTLPQEGDFLTLRILHDLRQRLSFTEAEHAEFGIEVLQETQQIRWKEGVEREVEIEIGPKVSRIIADRLEEMDAAKQLTPNHLSLYQKFVSPNEEDAVHTAERLVGGKEGGGE